MSDLDIEIRGARSEFHPGDEITGTVRWALAHNPGAIEVTLLWYTSGKGGRNSGKVDQDVWNSPGASGKKAFAFKLPHAPHSFVGKLIELHWAIKAVAVGPDCTRLEEFTLSPTGKPIRIHDPAGRDAPVNASTES